MLVINVVVVVVDMAVVVVFDVATANFVVDVIVDAVGVRC